MVSFEYIDDYFKGTKIPGKESDFEQRLLTDKEFAEDVTFYLNTIQVARTDNADIKKSRFKEIYYQNNSTNSTGVLKKLWPYALMVAALVTTLFVGVYIFNRPMESPKMAEAYLSTHLKTLGVQMNSTDDLLQQGKDLYNHHDYSASLKKFEEILQKDSLNYDAEENAGIVALKINDYDKALVHFTKLAKIENQNENSGKFYHALTLMKRNKIADKKIYIGLLKEVVRDNLYGKEDAEKFLEKFN